MCLVSQILVWKVRGSSFDSRICSILSFRSGALTRFWGFQCILYSLWLFLCAWYTISSWATGWRDTSVSSALFPTELLIASSSCLKMSLPKREEWLRSRIHENLKCVIAVSGLGSLVTACCIHSLSEEQKRILLPAIRLCVLRRGWKK